MGGSPQPQNIPPDRVGSSRRPVSLIGEEWKEHARDSLCKRPWGQRGKNNSNERSTFLKCSHAFLPSKLCSRLPTLSSWFRYTEFDSVTLHSDLEDVK